MSSDVRLTLETNTINQSKHGALTSTETIRLKQTTKYQTWCSRSTETIRLIRDRDNQPGVSVLYTPYFERHFGLLFLKGLI